jgi:hypothetical protein
MNRPEMESYLFCNYTVYIYIFICIRILSLSEATQLSCLFLGKHIPNNRTLSFFDYMAFGRIWQRAKYSYGVWQSFAYNSESFQKSSKIEKCGQFVQMFGFGPKQLIFFVLPARAPPSKHALIILPRLWEPVVPLSRERVTGRMIEHNLPADNQALHFQALGPP